jgi:thymidylate synthase (FAD)
MAVEMLKLVRPVAPTIFGKAGPGCLGGPCPEGAMCCGKMAEVRARFAEL